MRMWTRWALLLTVPFVVCEVSAVETAKLKGKWGVGVGIGEGTVSEVGIMRGLTDRTVLVLGLPLSYEQLKTTEEGTWPDEHSRRRLDLTAQLAARRYLGSSPKVRPYLGLAVTPFLDFGRSTYEETRETAWFRVHVRVAINLGAEYFIADGLGLAAHCPLLYYNWFRHQTEYSYDGETTKRTSAHHRLGHSIYPTASLRIYF